MSKKLKTAISFAIIFFIFAVAVFFADSGFDKKTEAQEPVSTLSSNEYITLVQALRLAPEARSEPEPAPSPTPAPSPSPKPTVMIYDIPLSEELQEYTYDLCQEYGVDYELVLAMMEYESSYRVEVISKTNDYGLMQINTCNHRWLKEELGIEDFLDAKQNILAGVYILSQLTARCGEDTNKVLMSYNFGEPDASGLWDQGIYSSKYSRGVISRAEELKEELK